MKLKQPITIYYGWLAKRVIIPAGSTCVPATNLPAGSGWWLKSTPRRANPRPMGEAPLSGLARGLESGVESTPPHAPAEDGFGEANQNILKSFEFKSWKRIYGVRITKEMLGATA